jgi:putative CocE/NonD family hydrolase
VKRLVFLIVVALVASVATAMSAPGVQRTDAFVRMSDGVRLEASVYMPSGPAPAGGYPIVVRQHGGGSNKDNGYDTAYGIELVETGNFALLMYSHRGHGNSEGLFDFFGPRTTKDFSEMIDWVERRFGARIDTDRVGAWGYSQGGGESLLPAAADPRVKAVAVGNTFADLNQTLNPNDCFKFSFATAIFALAYKSAAARTDDTLAVKWGLTFYTDTEDVGLPGVVSTTADLASRSPVTYVQELVDRRVPVFWTQSWEDQLFPGDHPERILGPLESAGVPVHYWFASGGHEAGPNDPADEAGKEAAQREWFDEFLRGVDHGFASGARPRVDYWERTAPGLPGTWVPRTAPSWPVPHTDLTLHARSGGKLAAAAGGSAPLGMIVNDLVTANVAYDPLVSVGVPSRVPIPGLHETVRSIPEGPNPLDTATFTGPRLGAPLHVVGAPVVHARLRTTARQVVQLAAKVWDVAPDGSRSLVNRNCVSVNNPGPAPVIDLALWPNAHTFPAGHRVELTLAAVDFPVFKPDVEPAVSTILGGTLVRLPVAAP